MLKIWGRNTSSNVQKVMWAIGELGLAHERVDIGGKFGGNKEPTYLAMNPNGLVPTLQEGDLTVWESNTIVRYLAARYGAGKLEPADWKSRSLASQWMDWQLSVLGPAITPAFWGLIRTPPEQRDQTAIAASQAKTTEAMKILDAALAKVPYVAGTAFSMGDIPVGIMAYRFRQLVPDVPERPPLPNFERWYKEIAKRPAFKEHVSSIPLQ
jgi:glutathione S-transferase